MRTAIDRALVGVAHLAFERGHGGSGDLAERLRGASRPWVTRFGVALRVLRFAAHMDGMSAIVRSIEARAVVQQLIDGIQREALPVPDLEAQRERFGPAFDRWMVAVSQDLAVTE